MSAALVSDALAWMLAQEDRPPRTAQAIASRLQTLYFEGDQHRDEWQNLPPASAA